MGFSVQELKWLAFLNMMESIISILHRREDNAKFTHEIKRKSWVPIGKVAGFIGQIISMSIVIGSLSQIITRYLSIDVLQAHIVYLHQIVSF